MIANKYVVDRAIGRGAFGAVFLGHKRSTGEPIAIKIEPSASSYLRHEVTIMNYLYGRGVRDIPRIYWFGPHEGNACLVMTYYSSSLSQYVGSLDLVMAKCILALSDIHTQQIIHRDIKPANILMNGGEPVFIDFGLATVITGKPTDGITGSPRFTSYYNHCGEPSSYRDDLISLGYVYIFQSCGSLLWDSGDHVRLKSWESIGTRLSGSILTYMKYCYELSHEDDPCYDLLTELFR